MKRGWKGAAFIELALCVTVLAVQTPAERQTHVVPGSSVPSGDLVSVTVDCAKVVNVMHGGLGASWHAMETPIPYGVKHPVFSGYSHGGSGWGAYPPAEDERAWQQIYRHADWLGLDWDRVEVEQRIYEPERDVFTFDSPEMRILYRILDWHQRSGAEVFFQQMWCNAAWLAYPEFRDDPVGRVHSAPVDLDAFADGLATLMEHLVKKRGYTCIKWLCITNEPGANFSWWQAPPNQPLSIATGLAAVRKDLDQRGLKLPLSGPDTTTGFPAQAPGALDYLGLLGAYDFHDYGADFDFRTKGHIAAQERNAARWVDLARREGKPVFLSEFGTMAYGWVPDKPGPSSPPSVLAGSELVVRLANAGVDGFNRWSFLNRGDLDGQWQLVDTWDPQAKKLRTEFGPHPNSYFCLGLLSRFTAQHSAILSSHVGGGKIDDWQRVFAAAFRSPAGALTLAIVNDAPAEFPFKLAWHALPKPERLYRYRYGGAEQERADVRVNPQAEFSLTPEANELKDTLPAASLTIYSTYKLDHDAPGVIVGSVPVRASEGVSSLKLQVSSGASALQTSHFQPHTSGETPDGVTTNQGGASAAPEVAALCVPGFHVPRILAGIALVCSVALPGPAAEDTTVKRIYLAPDDHTDYMWTLDEEGYRRAFLEMLDYYLDQIDATAHNPPPYQARWNCDGSFWLWTYERNKPPQDFERLIARVRDGHISVPLTALASCYGGQPAEAVLRGTYYAGSLERRYQLRFPMALAIEDQTMPFGLGALWAGAGAKYSWRGICACASRMRDPGDREHDVYWWKGADGSRILMKWNSLLTNNQSLGGYAEARDPFGVVDLVDSDPRFQRRWPYPVIGAFGKGGDDAKTLTDEFIQAAQSKTTGRRQVIVSNEEDFFRDFEATCGAQIPELSAGFGNEWDLYSASLAEVTTRVRRAVEKLRNAEAMATLVSLQRPDFARDRAAAREQAWMNLGLYWEHDWTADGKIISREARAAWQRRLAEQIESYVYALHADAAQALGAMIRSPVRSVPVRASEEVSSLRLEVSSGASALQTSHFKPHTSGETPYGVTGAPNAKFCVGDPITNAGSAGPDGRVRSFAFNSLGWTRTDVADLPWSDTEPVYVVDVSSDRQTPSQRVTVDGQRCLRVLARDVPPVGYKVFEVRPGLGETYADAATVNGNVMENPFYRITVAERGAITSLIDKTRGNREFAARIDGRTINDLSPGSGRLEVENAGPVSVTRLALSAEPLAHTSRVTLIRDSRRIEIDNAITQNFSDVRTWGFAFNLEEPDVWHEEVGAVIRAKLLAQGGHYSPRNARYDWLTMNHFVNMGGKDGVGVTLANADCCFMQLGRSTLTKLDTATPLISVLIGGQVDGPKLGIPDQGGDRYFRQRFALQTRGSFDPVEAMRFALEHQNPLVAGLVRGGTGYPAGSFSLLKVSRPELFVWAVKPAEEGIDRGVIMRIWNMAHHPVQGEVEFGRPVCQALRTTHIETDLSEVRLIDGRLPVSLAAQQLQTYRLTFARP